MYLLEQKYLNRENSIGAISKEFTTRMRLEFTAVLIVLIFTGTGTSSAVVSDLALMARSTNSHPQALVKLPINPTEPLERKYRKPPRTLILKDAGLDSNRAYKHDSTSGQPPSPPLSLWRVQILLGFLILAMTIALVIAAVNTARVFGVLSDPAQEDTAASIASKQIAAHEVDRDPESLTRLLTSHTMRGYGSMFSSALSGLVSPRRQQGARGDKEDQIIIQ